MDIADHANEVDQAICMQGNNEHVSIDHVRDKDKVNSQVLANVVQVMNISMWANDIYAKKKD